MRRRRANDKLPEERCLSSSLFHSNVKEMTDVWGIRPNCVQIVRSGLASFHVLCEREEGKRPKKENRNIRIRAELEWGTGRRRERGKCRILKKSRERERDKGEGGRERMRGGREWERERKKSERDGVVENGLGDKGAEGGREKTQVDGQINGGTEEWTIEANSKASIRCKCEHPGPSLHTSTSE